VAAVVPWAAASMSPITTLSPLTSVLLFAARVCFRPAAPGHSCSGLGFRFLSGRRGGHCRFRLGLQCSWVSVLGCPTSLFAVLKFLHFVGHAAALFWAHSGWPVSDTSPGLLRPRPPSWLAAWLSSGPRSGAPPLWSLACLWAAVSFGACPRLASAPVLFPAAGLWQALLRPSSVAPPLRVCSPALPSPGAAPSSGYRAPLASNFPGRFCYPWSVLPGRSSRSLPPRQFPCPALSSFRPGMAARPPSVFGSALARLPACAPAGMHGGPLSPRLAPTSVTGDPRLGFSGHVSSRLAGPFAAVGRRSLPSSARKLPTHPGSSPSARGPSAFLRKRGPLVPPPLSSGLSWWSRSA